MNHIHWRRGALAALKILLNLVSYSLFVHTIAPDLEPRYVFYFRGGGAAAPWYRVLQWFILTVLTSIRIEQVCDDFGRRRDRPGLFVLVIVLLLVLDAID